MAGGKVIITRLESIGDSTIASTIQLQGIEFHDWARSMSKCLNEDECQFVMEDYFANAAMGYDLEEICNEYANTTQVENENQKKGE